MREFKSNYILIYRKKNSNHGKGKLFVYMALDFSLDTLKGRRSNTPRLLLLSLGIIINCQKRTHFVALAVVLEAA
jgi:hypothetical protein